MIHTKDTKNEYKIQVVKSNYKPKPYDWVKIRIEGNRRATVIHQEKPTLTHIKKISATHYEVLSTGEIKEYQEQTVQQNALVRRQVLKRTFDQIKAIIRANFANDGEPGCKAQLFITLTYAENMTDEKKLYQDWEKFWKKLTYRIPGLEYLIICEPQKRGAWHIHAMVKSTVSKMLYIDKEIINQLWPHGKSTTERLKSDDIGNYYIAYFTGVLVSTYDNNAEEQTSEEVHQQEKDQPKSVIKGQRLGYYPKNFKFYRRSRGIIVPSYESDLHYGVQEEYVEIRSTSYDILKQKAEENETELLNRVYKAEYKRKSKGGGRNDKSGAVDITHVTE